MTPDLVAPTKIVRDYLNYSPVWNDFLGQGGFVEGDIVVAGPFKAGSMRIQRIVQQILSDARKKDDRLFETTPWLASSWGNHARMLSVLRQRRTSGYQHIIKSHLPADALPIAAEARYILVGRNGKDVGVSFHDYLSKFSASTIEDIKRIYATWSAHPTPLVIPHCAQQFFGLWLDTNGYGCCDIFDIMSSWWKLKRTPNVLLIHHQDLKDDLSGQIRCVADFLSVDLDLARMDAIVQNCSFGRVSGRVEKTAVVGAERISSTNRIPGDHARRPFGAELPPPLIERFDRIAVQKLGTECAQWLEAGRNG